MGLHDTAKDVAKALPLRLLHGGTYEAWINEFGVARCGVGVADGAGLPKVLALAAQLGKARADTVARMRAREPDWVARTQLAVETTRESFARCIAHVLALHHDDAAWEAMVAAPFTVNGRAPDFAPYVRAMLTLALRASSTRAR